MRVELVDITKRFGTVVANDDVSVTFEPGQVHGLLGENGAGKSTLMKVLAGWYLPERGRIRLDGREVVMQSPRVAQMSGIGYVPQDPQDFPTLTVLEHLVINREGFSANRRALAAEVEDVNRRMGFTLPPQARVGEITVGQRLQLAMAQAIVNNAQVIILDEPPMGSGLRDSLRQLAAEGRTVVYITHNVTEALAQCDRITVLRRGRRVGTVDMPTTQDELVRMMFEGQQTGGGGAGPARGNAATEMRPVLARLRQVATQSDPPLAGLSLTVHAGEVVGLAGIEGSGQAPLLGVLTGRVTPAGGERECPARRTHMVPAGRLGEGLVDGFTVEEMLALAHPTRVVDGRGQLDKQRVRELAQAAVEQFSIRGQPTTPVRSLSGGNQQRVMLAATPFDVDLLLLDNPTRGLDIPTASFVWSWIREQQERGVGVVVASNELEELWQNADRIIVLDRGRSVGEVVPGHDAFERLNQLVIGATMDALGATA